MIHEFAVDPEVVATWYQTELRRFFAREFGVGTPRIISRFPRSWKRRVWEEFRRSGNCNDLNNRRMTEVLKSISEKMINRTYLNWDDNKNWLECAESEHRVSPFRAIISDDNPRMYKHVIRSDSIDLNTPRWHLPTQRIVSRNAQDLQKVISPMLQIASKILFIDPYFHTVPRFLQPLEYYLKAIVKRGVVDHGSGTYGMRFPEVEIHRVDKSRRLCSSKLANILPHQLNVVIRTLRNQSGGQDLHDRYILTDVGGLQLPRGLDEGTSRTGEDLVDVLLLGEDIYRQRWDQYAYGAHAFEVVDTVRIKGRA